MSALIIALVLYALGCVLAFLILEATWQHRISLLVGASLTWPLVAGLIVIGALVEVCHDLLAKEAP